MKHQRRKMKDERRKMKDERRKAKDEKAIDERRNLKDERRKSKDERRKTEDNCRKAKDVWDTCCEGARVTYVQQSTVISYEVLQCKCEQISRKFHRGKVRNY